MQKDKIIINSIDHQYMTLKVDFKYNKIFFIIFIPIDDDYFAETEEEIKDKIIEVLQ